MIAAVALAAVALVATAPPDDPTTEAPTTTTVALTTTVGIDTMFPISVGADDPAVAAIQTTLDITIDCDYGPHTEQAVTDWQKEHDLAVTGEVGLNEWNLLAIPYTWGTDTNGNGTIDPSEVTLTCDETVPEADDGGGGSNGGSGECYVTDHFSTSGSWSRINCPNGPDIYSRCDRNFNCTSTVIYDDGDE
jgi:hypothetical protein